MKKQVLTFIAILPVAAFAQQLDSADVIPSIGDSTGYYLMLNPDKIEKPSAPSNNATWDYSSITFDDSATVKFEEPTTRGFPTDPASANVCEQFSGKLNGRIQFLASASTLYIVGDRKGSGIRTVQTNYGMDSLLKFKFPVKYNDSYTTPINSASGRGIITYRKGSYKVTVDGYGTLKLPYGDLKDIFRVKVELDYRDSLVIPRLPARITPFSTTTYEYWQKGAISYVMRIAYLDDDGKKSTEVIYRKPSEVKFNPTSVETISKNIDFKVYPNPANSFVKVVSTEITEKTEFKIINILGETKLSGNLENGTQINVEELIPGFYFIQIVGVNAAPIRFVKQ